MSSETFEQIISKTSVMLTPTGHRSGGVKTWRAMLNGRFPIATLSQLDNGEFVPESMERLRLNVLSLEENNMAWGVYHRSPRADIESPFGRGATAASSQSTPALRVECALTPGARLYHYQNPGDSLFVEIPSEDHEDNYCYQVLSPDWIVTMISLLNAQRHGAKDGSKRPMELGALGLDAKIEMATLALLSEQNHEGAHTYLTAVINAVRWPHEAPVTIAHVMANSADDEPDDIRVLAQNIYYAGLDVYMENKDKPCWSRRVKTTTHESIMTDHHSQGPAA